MRKKVNEGHRNFNRKQLSRKYDSMFMFTDTQSEIDDGNAFNAVRMHRRLERFFRSSSVATDYRCLHFSLLDWNRFDESQPCMSGEESTSASTAVNRQYVQIQALHNLVRMREYTNWHIRLRTAPNGDQYGCSSDTRKCRSNISVAVVGNVHATTGDKAKKTIHSGNDFSFFSPPHEHLRRCFHYDSSEKNWFAYFNRSRVCECECIIVSNRMVVESFFRLVCDR